MPIRPTSLRGRLVWPLTALLLLLAILSAIDAYRSAREAADTAYDRTLLAAARTISQRLQTHDGEVRLDVAFVALDSFTFDATGRIFYQANGPSGEWISGYDEMPAPPKDLAVTNDYPALAKFYDAEYRGLPVRMVSLLQPLPIGDAPGGMAEIRVGETLQAREHLIRSLLREFYARQALLVVCACALLLFAVRGALRPMERLREAVAARRLDDLRPVEPADMPRELKPLVTALNYWSGRVRTLFERQRRFIADASHQLRTPLSVMKSRIEVGLLEGEPPAMREALVAAQAGCDRMISLANRMLSIARIESGLTAVIEGNGGQVDMTTLSREVGVALAPLARSRSLDLSLEADHSFAVFGDETLLQEMVANLVENAIQHTPERGHVTVRLVHPSVLEIEDTGPGIPLTLRAHALEPFVSGREQGIGLGLAISAEIARAHGASIDLLDGAGGGLLVRIDFQPPIQGEIEGSAK